MVQNSLHIRIRSGVPDIHDVHYVFKVNTGNFELVDVLAKALNLLALCGHIGFSSSYCHNNIKDVSTFFDMIQNHFLC